ncbi:hypothetical protein [Nostoc piscinale]|uniref:hypothetical protein n=1 Tax=Nostoc piscinale TaxID=224012 RepID=UPI0039A6AE51
MQFNSSAKKISCAVVGSGSLAAVLLGLTGGGASAQITIQSTGRISGTLELPSFNPNFNSRVTRIDTDSQGVYQRNIGSQSNPNYVPVYKSDYVKVETRTDGSLHYFVDFKGIPVISFNGVLTSPALSGGQLTPFTYQGKIPNVSFQGVIQDEFGFAKAFYTGIVTDPQTGKQYQGTFQLNGQGPRYSDRNGGESPTVFDYKSDIPGTKPDPTPYEMKNTPLVRLTITVPADATLINSGGGTTPTTPTPPSVNNPSMSTPSTPISVSVDSGAIATTPITSNLGGTSGQSSPSPSTDSNMEFSSGSSPTANPVSLEVSPVAAKICHDDSTNCRPQVTATKQAIGPRSRVLVR